MKTKTLLFALFAVIAFSLNAQTDYSQYLDKAMSKLEAGECSAAQKYYNIYKELSGKSVPSLEVLISECSHEKKYIVGDKLNANGQTYIVAYTRDGGSHGIAVLNKGWQSLNSNSGYINRKMVPTLEELKLIYANRDKLGLYDVYWSCTKTSIRCTPSCYYTIDFASGKEDHDFITNNNCVILLIHRF